MRGLAIPLEWQEAVIRAAIGLKLCQHEETGAIVAALTTSIPEHDGSQRNWDYRYCWIRDAYYTVQALNRLGALDVLESYLAYLRNIVDAGQGRAHPAALRGARAKPKLEERTAPNLAGYRGLGPVRVGNQAYSQVQHDAYGQIVLSNVQAFFDQRLFRAVGSRGFPCARTRRGTRLGAATTSPMPACGNCAPAQAVHTYSAAMCWAACDRLANAAGALAWTTGAALWSERAQAIRKRIEEARLAAGHAVGCRRPSTATISMPACSSCSTFAFSRRTIRASRGHLARSRRGCGAGSHMLRYATEDDFGLPETAFNVCTFWLIEALHATGRTQDARALFEEMLERRTAPGCCRRTSIRRPASCGATIRRPIRWWA